MESCSYLNWVCVIYKFFTHDCRNRENFYGWANLYTYCYLCIWSTHCVSLITLHPRENV